ncbi:hypothetical protein KAR91_26910 [Candidatus Pacearchaeota archaeon]|nr:hypothetical protein [Candidatus Pacearchaeota archaeon]
MATLSTEDRQRISNGLQRFWSRLFEGMNFNSPELLAAINATDTWIDDNQASFNSALPAVAQSNMTATQKTLLFCVVATMRMGIGFLRNLVGEVD